MTMSKIVLIIILLILFTSLIIGCRGQKSKFRPKNCMVDSITMEYRNVKKFREMHGNRNPYSVTKEEQLQQLENYTIDESDWNVILDLLTTAVYHRKQIQERILPHDITLVINCSSGARTSVYLWLKSPSGRLKIDGLWHSVNPSKRAEFDSMISKYTESQEH